MPGEVQKTRGDYAAPAMAEQIESIQEKDPMARRETLELVRAYYQIDNVTVRKATLDLVRSIRNRVDKLIQVED